MHKSYRGTDRLYLEIFIIFFMFAMLAGFSCTGDPQADLTKGIFIAGGAVQGLDYRSGHKEGTTGADGGFYFHTDDTVTFSVGGVQIGQAGASDLVMSPIEMAGEDEGYVMHPTVLNMARFFQALDPDGDLSNGIELTEEIKNEFQKVTIPFNVSLQDFESHEAVNALFDSLNEKNVFSDTRGLPDLDQAKANLISNLLENSYPIPTTLINLGDDWTSGTHGGYGNINGVTQATGYTQVLFESMDNILDLTWGAPLLEMDETRTDSTVLPYNIGVPGATIKSLLYEQTGTGNTLLDTLTTPIATNQQMTQLEAALYLADLHPNRLKFITLSIGSNDVLGAITAENGTRLSADHINAFLENTEQGHDLAAIQANLTDIIDALAGIPDSYIFVANMPDVTHMGAIFSNEDIEAFAAEGASVTALGDGDYLGFTAFLNLGTDLRNNATLNNKIASLSADQGNVLKSAQVTAVNSRVAAVNTHINTLGGQYDNVTLVDIKSLFKSVAEGVYVLTYGAGTLPMTTRLSGGFFSLDGMNPSPTGYALVANEFIRTINASSLKTQAFELNYFTAWSTDPYMDSDVDGFVKGPEDPDTIDQSLVDLIDCDDGEVTIIAPQFSGQECLTISD